MGSKITRIMRKMGLEETGGNIKKEGGEKIAVQLARMFQTVPF